MKSDSPHAKYDAAEEGIALLPPMSPKGNNTVKAGEERAPCTVQIFWLAIWMVK
jgi:hypothetical protein